LQVQGPEFKLCTAKKGRKGKGRKKGRGGEGRRGEGRESEALSLDGIPNVEFLEQKHV
jgi:hypothetical protein